MAGSLGTRRGCANLSTVFLFGTAILHVLSARRVEGKARSSKSPMLLRRVKQLLPILSVALAVAFCGIDLS